MGEEDRPRATGFLSSSFGGTALLTNLHKGTGLWQLYREVRFLCAQHHSTMSVKGKKK